ncbi:MAG: DnaD domain protein [Firmicutes bacterium]|nr:DnaD domain protein [Bacillota bacterium]
MREQENLLKAFSFASEHTENSYTVVDNLFISRYLPNMDSDFVKVYLYGLYACGVAKFSAAAFENEINLPKDRILQAFRYFEKEGLVKIIALEPLTIEYLSLKNASVYRQYCPTEFEDFNAKLNEIVKPYTIVNVNEFNDYYNVIKDWRVEQEALLEIAAFCVKRYVFNTEKTGNTRYIITVAKEWAKRGLKKHKDVMQHITELELQSKEVKDVLRSLKGASQKAKREVEVKLADKQAYIKWTKQLGLTHGSIIEAAKSVGSIKKLDERLDEFFKLGIKTVQDIQNYAKRRKELFEIASGATKTLGLYYDNLDFFVETYFTPWLELGYSADTILLLAKDCAKAGIRTLEGMSRLINSFYKKGIVSEAAIAQHYESLAKQDTQIQELLDILGLDKNITKQDRDFFINWTTNWALPKDVINHAATLAKNAARPLAYMNSVLADYFAKGIKTLKEVEEQSKPEHSVIQSKTKGQQNKPDKTKGKQIIRHEYTKEQLRNMLLDDLDNFSM